MKTCDFCEKTQSDVALLIESKRKTFICDECVLGCVEIVFSEHKTKRQRSEECQGINGECPYKET